VGFAVFPPSAPFPSSIGLLTLLFTSFLFPVPPQVNRVYREQRANPSRRVHFPRNGSSYGQVPPDFLTPYFPPPAGTSILWSKHFLCRAVCYSPVLLIFFISPSSSQCCLPVLDCRIERPEFLFPPFSSPLDLRLGDLRLIPFLFSFLFLFFFKSILLLCALLPFSW